MYSFNKLFDEEKGYSDCYFSLPFYSDTDVHVLIFLFSLYNYIVTLNIIGN